MRVGSLALGKRQTDCGRGLKNINSEFIARRAHLNDENLRQAANSAPANTGKVQSQAFSSRSQLMVLTNRLTQLGLPKCLAAEISEALKLEENWRKNLH